MSRDDRLLAAAAVFGTDVKTLLAAVSELNSVKVDRGELSPLATAISDVVAVVNTKSTIYKATAGAPVGAGQAAGTWIARPV